MQKSAPLLTKDDVAERLRSSVRTVDRLTETGKLPAVKIGRLVRYREADVDAFINAEAAS